MQKVNFHLPGLFELFNVYINFLKLYDTEKEKFNEWAQIGSIYGAPYGTIWNGGRAKVFFSPADSDVVAFCKDYDLSCRFTFTNPFITEKHLNDTFCNTLLEKFNYEGHKNTIIVNSPILEQYLREKYPNYKLISSTTKCITDDKEAKDEVNKDYVMTVLDYNYNKNMEFLNSIEHKEKVELLINPVCQPNCPRRKRHYDYVARISLHQDDGREFECEHQMALFYQAQKSPLFISVDDIQNIYAPMGFQNFKIEGRTTTEDDLIEILTYYMVKPEYQLEIRQKLLHAILFGQ